MFFRFDYNDAWPRLFARFRQGRLKLAGKIDAPGSRSKRGSVPTQIDGQIFALQSMSGFIPGPKLVAKASAHARHLQLADQAVVLTDNQRDLQFFLERRHEFARVHQVCAVADQHLDFSRGLGEAHSQARGQLISHARVAHFQMAAASSARVPEFVEIAGQTCGSHNRVARLRLVIDDSNQFSLADCLAFHLLENLFMEDFLPVVACRGDFRQVG